MRLLVVDKDSQKTFAQQGTFLMDQLSELLQLLYALNALEEQEKKERKEKEREEKEQEEFGMQDTSHDE